MAGCHTIVISSGLSSFFRSVQSILVGYVELLRVVEIVVPNTCPEKYSLLLRLLHWGMAVIILGLLVSGLIMSDLPKSYRYDVYGLHKSFGVIILGLVWLRLAARLVGTAPPMPSRWGRVQNLLAQGTHALLYLMMLIMPISGYIMSNAKGYGVSLFGWSLPRVVQKHPPLGDIAAGVHHWVGYAFIVLLLLHVAAVIKHLWRDKENIRRRIW